MRLKLLLLHLLLPIFLAASVVVVNVVAAAAAAAAVLLLFLLLFLLLIVADLYPPHFCLLSHCFPILMYVSFSIYCCYKFDSSFYLPNPGPGSVRVLEQRLRGRGEDGEGRANIQLLGARRHGTRKI